MRMHLIGSQRCTTLYGICKHRCNSTDSRRGERVKLCPKWLCTFAYASVLAEAVKVKHVPKEEADERRRP